VQKNTRARFGWVAKILHWLIAVIIIGLLTVGIIMTDMPAPQKFELYGLHKATGIVVLALVILRILWRAINVQPRLPADLPRWQKMASFTSHLLLYLLMLLMPLSGWLMSSAGGYPVTLYGLYTMPNLVGKDADLGKLGHELHEIGMIMLIVLIVVHVAAALQHHFIRKDNVLKRMLPFGKV
jgi:cytochrome b561